MANVYKYIYITSSEVETETLASKSTYSMFDVSEKSTGSPTAIPVQRANLTIWQFKKKGP